MELENIILSGIRHRRPKIACSPYANYRPKTNAATLLGRDHSKGRRYMGGIGQGKETKT
jgi:hypothetical protein